MPWRASSRGDPDRQTGETAGYTGSAAAVQNVNVLLRRLFAGPTICSQTPRRQALLRAFSIPDWQCRFGSSIFMMEFHISREARQRYQFSDTLFSFNGNVVFADMPACRRFAHQMNLVREADKNPELAIHAGSLFAMGLIDEASHVLIARYREQFDSTVMADALSFFGEHTSPDGLDKLLLAFVEHFPG